MEHSSNDTYFATFIRFCFCFVFKIRDKVGNIPFAGSYNFFKEQLSDNMKHWLQGFIVYCLLFILIPISYH